jgi:mono/diheme cytochrome c family protein
MRTSSLALGALVLCARLGFGGEGVARAGSLPLLGAPQSPPEKVNPYQGSADAARAGRKLFERHCADCHGPDAVGSQRAPALNTRTVRELPPGNLFWFLTNGNRRAGMPSWSRLPDARRWQIVEFLKTLASRPEGQ